MNWAKDALAERTWKKRDVTIAGKTGQVFVRRLTPTERTRLWGGVFVSESQLAAIEATAGDDAGQDEITPDVVARNLEVGKEMIRLCFAECIFDMDSQSWVRGGPLFDKDSVEELEFDEIRDLADMVSELSGLGGEAPGLVRHFQDEPARG